MPIQIVRVVHRASWHRVSALWMTMMFRWMLAGTDSLGEREVKRKVRGEDRVANYGAVGAEAH